MLENCIKKGENPVNYYLLFCCSIGVGVGSFPVFLEVRFLQTTFLNSYGGTGRRARLKILSE